MNKPNIYLALIHHPVINKFGDIITTSITNLDIHDISRSCLTFEVKNFFIVTPLSSQKQMISRIMKFWQTEAASNYNAFRSQALNIVRHADTFDDVIKYIQKQESNDPVVVGTTAIERNDQMNYGDFCNEYLAGSSPVLLLFGTGNGLAQSILSECDLILEPVYGSGQYNHLSVRSAAAIILDRLTSVK